MPWTTNKGFSVQTTSSNSGVWGADGTTPTANSSNALNEGVTQLLDQLCGSTTTLSLGGAATTNLTQLQTQKGMLRITGALTGNQIISPDAGVLWTGFVFWENVTTGSFTVTITNSAGSVALPQSQRGIMWIDTTNAPRIVAGVPSSGYPNLRFADDTGIQDDSGNKQLIFQKTASAVNYVDITNAATGSDPTISANGTDTDVDLLLAGKGAGVPKIGANAIIDAGDTASTSAAGVIEIATAAEMAAASSTSLAATPGTVVNHPGVAKAVAFGASAGGTLSGATNYNVNSITRTGTGLYTVTLTTAMASTAYGVTVSCSVSGDAFAASYAISSVTVFTVAIKTTAGNLIDQNFTASVWGVQ